MSTTYLAGSARPLYEIKANLFKALAHPARIRILEILTSADRPVPVSEIPILAAKVRGSRATVFVADGGVVHKVMVDVVGERDGSLFVKTDLPAGAQVVTQGRSLLANNDRVAVKVAGPAEAKP